MTAHDVLVVGAGLAGLSAARDLMNGGADVVVVEARARAGGRVEQTSTADGRLVQLGGEVIGDFHTAYRELVAELDLTIVPSFTDIPGVDTWLTKEGVSLGDDMPWLSDEDRRCYQRVEAEFAALTRSVDPDDPWSHPDAIALDRISVGDWLRSQGATPNVVRALELRSLGLAEDSVERRSRRPAQGGSGRCYRVLQLRRLGEGQSGRRVSDGCTADGRGIGLPDSVLQSSSRHRRDNGWRGGHAENGRDSHRHGRCLRAARWTGIQISGVSSERLDALCRHQHASAAKYVPVYSESFWERNGQNGTGYFEDALLGGTWVQNDGILSALVPVNRLGPYFAAPRHLREGMLRGELARAYGPEALAVSEVFIRDWAVDPWTQGYITAWQPGELTAIGPQHGTHEPPFWVVGSDQWVCGYMEGAVRTGRAAAREMLARG